jgi:hypothetical protein
MGSEGRNCLSANMASEVNVFVGFSDFEVYGKVGVRGGVEVTCVRRMLVLIGCCFGCRSR